MSARGKVVCEHKDLGQNEGTRGKANRYCQARKDQKRLCYHQYGQNGSESAHVKARGTHNNTGQCILCHLCEVWLAH